MLATLASLCVCGCGCVCVWVCGCGCGCVGVGVGGCVIHEASQVLPVLPDKEGLCLLCVCFLYCMWWWWLGVCVVERNYVRFV